MNIRAALPPSFWRALPWLVSACVALPSQAATIVCADDFEHDSVGAQPAKPTLMAPVIPGSSASTLVVNEAGNPAGTGKGVRFKDTSGSTSVYLQYEFTRIADVPPAPDIPNGLISTARIDLSLAPLTSAGGGSHSVRLAVGEFGADLSNSLLSFIDCRLFDDGTVDFVSGTGPDSTGHALSPSGNTLSIFINDLDAGSLSYTGPDDSVYSLPANSVAYWLNGARISFGGQGYTALENGSTANGGVFASELNVGRFGIVSSSAATGLDYVFDDLLITDLGSQQDPSGTSWLVAEGPDGSLVYGSYANQNQANTVNTVPDFSITGYQGGGVAIPFVPAVVTLTDNGPSDDTVRIQNAINSVAALPIGPEGFRGAVVLGPGTFTVSSTLQIGASGIVIRGAGSDEVGGTRIDYTSTVKSDLFVIDSAGSGPSEIGGTRADITDSFVPVGATSFNVSDAGSYAPGDDIIVKNTVNTQWLIDLSDMTQWGWTTSYYSMGFRRTVVAVSGNRITIDAPIMQTIEDQYGGGIVYKYSYSDELENIGIEALRLVSAYAHPEDEDHGWTAVNFNNTRNGWARQVTAKYFAYACVAINGRSRNITVEDCAMLDAVCTGASGRRYSFSVSDSDSTLVQRSLTRGGRHDFVSGSVDTGPHVFVDCRATETWNDIGPHHRYSTGQLYDNIYGGEMNVQNRSYPNGTLEHGWAGAQVMFWNCDAASIVCDAPNGAMNWAVGSTGVKRESHRTPDEPFGIWDSHNQAVTPRSLYYAQLAERLGFNALQNVIIPEQKAGNVWNSLILWDGDGLFGDPVVAWQDEESFAIAGYPIAVRGVVRQLRMLDRGVSVLWSKVSGPGTAVFADPDVMETTVTCSQPGVYTLNLFVDDGTEQSNAVISIYVDDASDPPLAPSGLNASAGDGSVALDWRNNEEPDLLGYDIYRATTSGDAGLRIVEGHSSSEYVDNTVQNGVTYYYTIIAVDEGLNPSPRSAEVTASPVADLTAPAAPSGLIAVTREDQVLLDWAPNSETDFSSYRVYRSTLSGSLGTLIASNFAASQFTDQLAVNDTVYYYIVTAMDMSGNESPWSEAVSASRTVYQGGGHLNDPAAWTAGVPVQKLGIVSINATYDSTVTLSGYNLLHMDGEISRGNSFSGLDLGAGTYWEMDGATALLKGRSLKLTDAEFILRQGTADMRENVRDTTIAGASANFTMDSGSFLVGRNFIIQDSARVTVNGGTLTIATNLSSPSFASPPSAMIFNGGTISATSYSFPKASIITLGGATPGSLTFADVGTGLRLNWLPGSKMSVTITGAVTNWAREFWDLGFLTCEGEDFETLGSWDVVSSTGLGNGYRFAFDAETKTLTLAEGSIALVDTTPPAVPSGISATAGDRAVTLDWADVIADDLLGYQVYRSTVSGEYPEDPISTPLNSEFEDTGLTSDVTYYYVVRSFDDSGNVSAQSDEVEATPFAVVSLAQINFGSDFDGYAQFGTSTIDVAQESWGLQANSVRYVNEDPDGLVNSGTDGGTRNGSLLRSFILNRVADASYKIEGVIYLADGYADDNNRVGIYLFGDAPDLGVSPADTELGALFLGINLDTHGVLIVQGINGSQLASVTKTEGLLGQNLFGTALTFTATVTFTATSETMIDFALTDALETVTQVSATVPSVSYTGDYFGFATRSRNRGVTGRDAPFTMDYQSFLIEDLNPVDSDTDGDSIDDGWEQDNFGDPSGTDGSTDSDGDGVADFFEYLYGSDPNDSNQSGFSLSSGRDPVSGNPRFVWDTEEARVLGIDYLVEVSINLSQWDPLPEAHYSLTQDTVGGKTTLEMEITHDYGSSVFIRLRQP